MVNTSLIRPQLSRFQERLKSNVFKVSLGWVALVGISIFCFTVVKKDALEKRKEHLRIKKEIKQEIIDEIEISSKKQ